MDLESIVKDVISNSCDYCTTKNTDSKACELCKSNSNIYFKCDLSKLKSKYNLSANSTTILAANMRNKCQLCSFKGCKPSSCNYCSGGCKEPRCTACEAGSKFTFSIPCLKLLINELKTFSK